MHDKDSYRLNRMTIAEIFFKQRKNFISSPMSMIDKYLRFQSLEISICAYFYYNHQIKHERLNKYVIII